MKPLHLMVVVGFLFGHCQSMKDNLPLHHNPSGGFQNPNPAFIKHGFGSLFQWGMTRWKVPHSIDPEDYAPFPIVPNDGKALRDNSSRLSVTWIGHATNLVQIDGINILTDPIWSERCSPVSFAGPKRYTPPGLDLDNLPPIHLVVLSHNHYDHTDLPTLVELEKRFHPQVYIGLGNAKWLRSEGIAKVEELDWWEERTFQNLGVIFTPTQHFSGRSLNDRDESLWGSFVFQGKKHKVYFAGDTGYYTHFKEIGQRFPELDVAILPIGAYEPRWFMSPVHVDPIQAVQAFVDLKAKQMVPMHYGTFVLSDERLDAPLRETQAAFQAQGLSGLKPLKIGESSFF